jgi:uncharacterized protein YdeI (YjbR/CyaY-like superfamily)
LQDNHDRSTEVWLVFYKKHTGKSSIAYRDAVEEAICHGWIDGLKRRIDDERYAYRFTPRRRNSKWSPLNLRLEEFQSPRARLPQTVCSLTDPGR